MDVKSDKWKGTTGGGNFGQKSLIYPNINFGPSSTSSPYNLFSLKRYLFFLSTFNVKQYVGYGPSRYVSIWTSIALFFSSNNLFTTWDIKVINLENKAKELMKENNMLRELLTIYSG